MANSTPTSSETFQRKIASFCEMRLSPLLQPRSIENLSSYMLALIGHHAYPPMKFGKLDWQEIALACDLTNELTADVKRTAQHGFDAISRWLAANKAAGATRPRLAEKQKPTQRLPRNRQAAAIPSAPAMKHSAKTGPQPAAIEEFPSPLFDRWEDPVSFQASLELHMRRFGESYYYLHRAVIRPDETFDNKTILSWLKGTKVPRTIDSLELLGRIERRYRLPSGYFKAKLPHQSRSASGHDLGDDISADERRRLAWHLPDNFNSLPFTKREEILEWVRRVIISGSTDYRSFQAAASKQRYAIRFPAMAYGGRADIRSLKQTLAQSFATAGDIEDPDILSGVIEALPRLAMEMADLLVFPGIWDWYLQWRERRRGFFTAWEADMLSISLSLTREETGWLRQHPELIERVVPIEGLVTAEEIAFAKRDWHACCDAFHKHARNRIKEIQRVMRVHRDPFEPIMCVLEAPSPLAEYRKITDEILMRMPDKDR